MLHESLWQQNADITQRCREHAFEQRLADGTLDRDVFRQYVAQDAFFLRAFLKASDIAEAINGWPTNRVCGHFGMLEKGGVMAERSFPGVAKVGGRELGGS